MHKCFTSFKGIIRMGIIMAVIIFCFMGGQRVQAATEITQMENDINVIPDKYNANVVTPKDGFKTIDKGSTFSVVNTDGKGMLIRLQSAENEEKINLAYANADLEGTIVFENIDFSATMEKLTILSAGERINNKKAVHFVFKNCVFNNFSCPREGNEYVTYTFERCRLKNFFGSNATFNRCYFGGGIGDRIVPFCRVWVNDCYIVNPTSELAADGEIHVDGTQIYAWKSTEAYDIHFSRCRFEMPAIKYPYAPKAYVNACIMLQLEFNSGHDISFTDCSVNGGGMCIYARTKNDQYTLSNVTFKNITFGCAQKYGWLYPKYAENLDFNMGTWKNADSVWISNVYREKSANDVLLVVSNDTNKTRTFKVFTSSGKSYDFEIEACPLNKDFGNMKFEDFPFDKIYKIPEYCDWLVCYETTGGIFKQIRYKNWTDKYLVLTEDSKGQKHVVERPKGTPVSKLTRTANSINVRWKSRRGKVTGYQIQYSTSPNFTKKTSKIVVVRNSKTTSTKINKLQKNKIYYVRVRTYRTRKIANEKQNIYSGWSTAKKIRTRK